MGRRTITWGLRLCLVLLLLELVFLAATGNWVALIVTLATIGVVTVVVYLVFRPRARDHRRLH
jgi:hypothetical protein